MFASPTDILVILEQYKYLVIFPIVIFEGPIITVISGFLIYLGVLNIYFTYPLLIIGDLIGDSLYYSIGRFGGNSTFAKKYAHIIGYTKESAEFLKNHFEKHKFKTLFIAKFSHGMGGTIQALSGVARVNFYEFLLINFIGIIPKTLILLTLGYYIGDSYVQINQYLNSIALIFVSILLLVFMYFISNKYIKKYFAKNDILEDSLE